MKKFYGLMLVFTLALTGCSNDDKSTIYNDAAGTNDINLKADCPIVNGITGLDAYSQSTTQGSAVTFLWDQGATIINGRYYTSNLEVTYVLNPFTNHTSVTNTYPINYFGSSSFTLNPGPNVYQFSWKIVVKGYNSSTNALICTSTSAPRKFSY